MSPSNFVSTIFVVGIFLVATRIRCLSRLVLALNLSLYFKFRGLFLVYNHSMDTRIHSSSRRLHTPDNVSAHYNTDLLQQVSSPCAVYRFLYMSSGYFLPASSHITYSLVWLTYSGVWNAAIDHCNSHRPQLRYGSAHRISYCFSRSRRHFASILSTILTLIAISFRVTFPLSLCRRFGEFTTSAL